MTDLEKTLQERGSTYGEFDTVAEVCNRLIAIMITSPSWRTLSHCQKVAAIMIQMKLARILCGAPFQLDSWHDIAGYATLTERCMLRDLERSSAKQ